MLHPQPSNVSLRAVAEEAGVSVTTASRALNDNPKIAAETRLLVRKAAEKLGYQKSASVSALMRNFRTGGTENFREAVAFLANDPQEQWARLGHEFNERILSGVRSRAANLGYQVDVFWTRSPERSLARLGSMLRARGVRGLILGPLPELSELDGFPWQHFSTVTIGYMLKHPRFHRVQTDMYENMSVILDQFAARGYRRVAFITNPRVEHRLGSLAAARYALYQDSLPAARRIPVLMIEGDDHEELSKWLNKHRPDAVVSQLDYVWPSLRNVKRADGTPVGFAWLSAQLNEPEISGTVPLQETIGAACLDLLASLLAHNDMGIPQEPRSVLIPGLWRDGETVRRM